MEEIKITEEDYKDLLIASLPTRPTAPAAFGGKGYSATELKEAFDAFPMLISKRLNMLLEYIEKGYILSYIKCPSGDDLEYVLEQIQNTLSVILNHLGISVEGE